MKRDLLSLRDADDATWAVFADELISEGDPRGELMKLQLELEHRVTGRVLKKRERELVAAEPKLSGRAAVLASVDATWRRGFLHRVRSPSLVALRALLTHESGALLDELVLDNPRLPMSEQVELVGKSGHRALRSLQVRSDDGDTRYEDPIEIGGVLGLPALTELSVVVRELRADTRRKEPSSAVKALELSAHSIPLSALGRWTFPALERLELSVLATWTRRHGNTAWDNPAQWPVLQWPDRFWSGEAVPKLSSLTLRQFRVDAEASRVLEKQARRGVLRELDLSGCEVDDRGGLPFVASLAVTWPR